MSKGKKFVTGCCIAIGIGVLLSGVGIAMDGRVTGINLGPGGIAVYTPSGTAQDEEIVYQTGEEKLTAFDSIRIEADYADIAIEPAEDYGISYRIDSRYRLSYKITNGMLTIVQENKTKYSFFSFGYVMTDGTQKEELITVKVPKGSELSSVKIEEDYGDIVCSGFSAEKLEIASDYGDIGLEEVTSAEKLEIDSDYGDVVLEDIAAGELSCIVDGGNLSASRVTAETVTVENDYGDIGLEEATAGEMSLTADYGMISLKNVETEKLAFQNEYGDVEGENVRTGSLTGEMDSGDCDMKKLDVKNVKLDSDYGNVNLNLTGRLTSYHYNLQTDYGKIMLGNRELKESYQTIEQDGDMLEIYCDSGDIELQGAE